MNVEDVLREYGLNEKEVKVYLATLECGQSKVHGIAKKTHILRETTYFVLQSLINKGLVSYVIKSGVKYFEAAAPSTFLSILKEREDKIKRVMPELETLQRLVVEKPIVELYEGKEGLKTILSDIIHCREPLWAYANEEIFRLLEYEFPNFIGERIKYKIKARIIQEKTKFLKKAAKQDNDAYREMRFSPIIFRSNVFIYGNNLAIISVTREQPFGIVIQNKIIADTQRQVFELLWKMSE